MTRERRLPTALLLPFLGLLVAAWTPATGQSRADSQREALRARIEKLRAELADTEEDRNEAREELRESEKAISTANRSLRELSTKRDAARRDTQSLTARKHSIEGDLAGREQDLARLLNAIYRAGEPGLLKTILSGQDPNQTARNLYYLGVLSKAQFKWIHALRDDLARLRGLEEELRTSAEEIRELERAQKSQRDELMRQQQARRKVLDKVSLRLQAQRRQVKLLEADEQRLSRLVERIARVIQPQRTTPAERPRAAPEAVAPAIKGASRLPVRGTVIHRFGASRPEGGPPWKGLFIQAPPGSEVRAAAAGQVVFAEWMRGYGNLLILDHGDAYLTIYGNNESLLRSVGDSVAAGDPVATVGARGGGGETGLYFEARHEGKPFDPTSWITLR